MKIICTEEEKQALIYAYEQNPKANCLLPESVAGTGCIYKYKTCKECIEEKIDWVIKENKE